MTPESLNRLVPLPVNSETDISSWLQRARSGDKAALLQLLDAHRPRLLDRIRLLMGPSARRAADSHDFMHDVLVEALRGNEKMPLESEQALLRWLTAIARNRIRTELRRDRERAFGAFSDSLSPKSGDQTPSGVAVREESRARLVEALETLPRGYCIVIELRDFEGLSFADIGTRIGRSADAARKLHTRAIIRLGELLR